MAYVRIECAVARNRKFVKAGPAPSWLWLCGLLYCQDSMTDGFIPRESLPYLGVKNAAQLAAHLVKAGLWHEADGGWEVNDYLEHNKSAAEVSDLKARRGDGGKHGGRPKKNLRETLKVSASETFPVAVGAVVDAAVAVEGSARETSAPLDVWLRELQEGRYPPHRVTRNSLTETEFCSEMMRFKAGPRAAWTLLCANLDANINSYEWRVKGMVPWLLNYLKDGKWQNAPLPADAPAADRMSKSTAITLQGGADFLKQGA